MDYQHGVNSTLPTCGDGLGWTRSGYAFKGWATSAANASKGILWKGGKGNVASSTFVGNTMNVYAIWALAK